MMFRSIDKTSPQRLHTMLIQSALAVMAGIAMLSSSASAEPKFGIHGSDAIGARLMPALIEGYASAVGYRIVREPGVSSEEETLRGVFGVDAAFEISLERYGSSTSFKGLQTGQALIGMSSRQIKDKEVAAILDASGVSMVDPGSEHVIALDGLAVIVSPDNPLPAISLETAARIFAGDIKDWSELGLPPGPITVHARDENSGTWDTFKSLVLKPTGLSLRDDAARYSSNRTLAQAVAADSRAIGFTGLAVADLAKTLPIALECGMVVRPDSFTVKAEEYPLGRRLYLYTVGAPRSPEAAKLVNFASSDAAQPIIRSAGFVDQSVEYQDFISFSDHIMGAMQLLQSNAEVEALKRLLKLINDQRRLSLTFRFEPGGVLLDGKSVADAGRLARWMAQPENQGVTVSLIGFADSIGGYAANQELSQKRAEAVRRAVLIQSGPGLDPKRIQLHGFSTIAPIACNSTSQGRAANRRVEVWVSK